MAQEKKITINLPHLTQKDFDGSTMTAKLQLTTDKGERGISSTALVGWTTGSGFFRFAIGGDFYKTMARDKEARGTQKNIDAQHAATFTESAIEGILAEILAFYTLKGKVVSIAA